LDSAISSKRETFHNMNAIDPKQATIFVIVFFVIALLINSTQGYSHSRTQSPASNSLSTANPQLTTEAAQAAQNAAAEHAHYLAKYLNGGFTRKAGARSIAIVVVTETGKLNPAVNSALARRLQNESTQILPSLFKPEFVSDGLFNDAIANSSDLFQKLDLANSVDSLVLAREDVQYAQNPALENVITATMRLDVTVVPISGQGDSKTWTFTANGPGFNQTVARAAAEERLIKQIAADTKMSLN
jgi:hypothetical protein